MKINSVNSFISTIYLFRLLEDTLNFMTKTAQHSDQVPHDTTGKFWKALLHKAYEIVDKVRKSFTISFLTNNAE